MENKQPTPSLVSRAALAFPGNLVAQMALQEHLDGKQLSDGTLEYLNKLMKGRKEHK